MRSSSLGALHACPDLWRRRHRRLDRLFPELSRRRGGRRGADGHRLRRVRQVRRFPGARLVRRHAARSAGATSFALHASLAESIGGDWGYRRLITYGGFASARNGRPVATPPASIGCRTAWPCRRLGSTATTAQVHPGQFTASMMRAAEARGPCCASGRSRASSGMRRGSRVSRSMAGSLKGTRSSLPWGPGRYWPLDGCRCRPCSG